jgi:hypothetical protein
LRNRKSIAIEITRQAASKKNETPNIFMSNTLPFYPFRLRKTYTMKILGVSFFLLAACLVISIAMDRLQGFSFYGAVQQYSRAPVRHLFYLIYIKRSFL